VADLSGEKIYAIQEGTRGPIKIGYGDAEARLKALKVGNPRELTIILDWPGGRAEEQAIHAKLAPYRIRGEWFQDCRAVMEVLLAYGGDPTNLPKELHEALDRKYNEAYILANRESL
jgi:hypothetical protein